MSTATIDPETATPFKPTREAVDAYRESVRTGHVDLATLDAVRKIHVEWQRDRKTWLARVAAHKALTQDAPQLEAAAQEALAFAQSAANWAATILPDAMTLAEIRDRLREIAPQAPMGTASQLAAVLAMVPGHALRLRERANDAKVRADDVRTRAIRELRDTADPAIGKQIAGLRVAVQSHENHIKAREEILTAPERIRECRAQCERFAGGDVPDDGIPRHLLPALPPAASAKVLYQRERRRLDVLLTLAAQRDEALAANRADEEAIARLREQIAAKSAELLAIENMAWLET